MMIFRPGRALSSPRNMRLLERPDMPDIVHMRTSDGDDLHHTTDITSSRFWRASATAVALPRGLRTYATQFCQQQSCRQRSLEFANGQRMMSGDGSRTSARYEAIFPGRRSSPILNLEMLLTRQTRSHIRL
jgi:hypothetical protein